MRYIDLSNASNFRSECNRDGMTESTYLGIFPLAFDWNQMAIALNNAKYTESLANQVYGSIM